MAAIGTTGTAACWPKRVPLGSPFDQPAVGRLELGHAQLGFHPDAVFTKLKFQVTDMGVGGSYTLSGRGPAGTYTALKAGVLDDEIVIVTQPHSAYELAFTGGSGAAKVYVEAHAEGF